MWAKTPVSVIAAIILTLSTAGSGRTQTLSDLIFQGKTAATLADHMRHPQFQAELLKAKQAGLPTTIAEIIPKMPPAYENAALVYMAIYDAKKYPVSRQDAAAYNVLKLGSHTDAEWSAARTFVTNHTALLAAIHKAASLPTCVMPMQYAGGDPASIRFRYLGGFRLALGLLEIESLVLAKDGKSLNAVRNETLGFHISEQALTSYPILVSVIEFRDLEAATLRCMQHILLLRGNDPAVAAAVEGAVDRYGVVRSGVPALRDEFALGIAETQYIWKNGPQALMDAAGNGSPQPPFNLPPRMFNALMDANGTYLIKLERESIDAASLPYPQASVKYTDIVNRGAISGDMQTFLSSFLFPAWPPDLDARYKAEIAVTQAAAAAFEFKGKRGQFPDVLSDAMTTVPTDPFDLKPIRYRREVDGFVVYSVGETGKYDGLPEAGGKHFEVMFRYPEVAAK